MLLQRTDATAPPGHPRCHDVRMSTGALRPPSRAELLQRGRDARKTMPRRDLAVLASGARDPLGILAEQDAGRIPDLVPLRAERMAASPFAFFRGTAALMAADLADAPHSGILVASCGDAHVSNFGFYASAQRDLMFDLNDFDEAAWAPWEWDLKRLTASVVVGGRASGRADEVVEQAVRAAVAGYARGIRRNTKLSPTQRYFTHFDVEQARKLLDPDARRAIRKAVEQAQRRTGERAVRRHALLPGAAAGRRRQHDPHAAQAGVAERARAVRPNGAAAAGGRPDRAVRRGCAGGVDAADPAGAVR